MTTELARQIAVRMKAKNISIITLEKDAGLRSHMVRNILRGYSKKPRIDVVQRIARTLDCTLDDLLQGQDMYADIDDEDHETRKEVLANPYDPDMVMELLKIIKTKEEQGKYNLTLQQLITCIEEIYIYSVQKGSEKVDDEFADWFIDMVIEGN